ncbi:hypothetical protein [Planococcus faecalis]|uniref:hypothetical protein n=1 Tax=Planococcus faecalis TaxID=1598147 RepID=UPI0008DAD1DB|nr:hypothetical protein [Planococcus faecalis]OHX51863.1 hypothetical protein BB777_14700 [Planococcus faecalis]
MEYPVCRGSHHFERDGPTNGGQRGLQKIAASEEVLAIDRGLDKATGGAFPYYFYVNVRTDQQSYLFYCDGPECSTMDNEGWGYSIYEDEDTRLPFRGN